MSTLNPDLVELTNGNDLQLIRIRPSREVKASGTGDVPDDGVLKNDQ